MGGLTLKSGWVPLYYCYINFNKEFKRATLKSGRKNDVVEKIEQVVHINEYVLTLMILLKF